MFDLPTHPALAHIPLGFAVALPIVVVFIIFFLREPQPGERDPMWLAVILAAIIVATGYVGLSTGKYEETLVRRVTNLDVIRAHANAAKYFFWVACAVLTTALGAALVSRPRVRRALVRTTFVLSLVMLAGAVVTGHRGGILVFGNGAASAPRPAKK